MYELSKQLIMELESEGVKDVTADFAVPPGFSLKACFAHRGRHGWQTVAVVGLQGLDQGFVAGGGMKLKPVSEPFGKQTLVALMEANVEAAATMAEKFTVAGPFFANGAPIAGTKFLAAVPNTDPTTITETIQDMVKAFEPLLVSCLGTGGDENAPFPEVRRIMRNAGFYHPQQGIIAGLGRGVRETCYLLDEVCQRRVEVPVVGAMPVIDMASGFTTFISLKAAVEFTGRDLAELHVGVQGIGALGLPLLGFLSRGKAVVTRIAAINGMVVNDKGIDIQKIVSAVATEPPRGWKIELFPVEQFSCFTGQHSVEETMTTMLQGVALDAILPCAGAHAITESNLRVVIKALSRGPKLVISGANDGITGPAVAELIGCGAVIPPDFVVNAGVATVFGAVEDGRITQPDQNILMLLEESTRKFVKRPPQWRT